MSAQGRGKVVGKARVVIGADDAELVKGLRNVQRRMRAFGATMTAVGKDMMMVGAGIAAPLLAASKRFVTVGDELDKMAGRTKASVENLSALSYVAERVGESMSDVEKGILQLRQQIIQANNGLSTSTRAFDALGLSVRDFDGLNTDRQLEKIAEAVSAIPDPVKRAEAVIEFFGKRAGAAMLPIIENMKALRQEAEDRGLIVSTEDAATAAILADNMTNLKSAVDQLAIAVGGSLAPTLIAFAESATEGVGRLREWVKENEDSVSAALRGSAAIFGLGAAFYAVGVAAKIAAVGVGALRVGLVGVFKISAGVTAAMGALKVAGAAVSGAFGAASISSAAFLATLKAGVVAKFALGVDALNVSLVKLTAVGLKGALLAAGKFIALPLAVAFAGWNLGKWIAEWTGLASAIEAAYRWLFSVKELSDKEVNSKLLDGWKKQLEDGRISLEEYEKRLKALSEVKPPDISGNQKESIADMKEIAEQAELAGRAREDASRRQLTLDELWVQKQYEGIEAAKALNEVRRQAAIEAADGQNALIDIINQEYDLREGLIDVEEERAKQRRAALDAERAAVDLQREKQRSEEEAARALADVAEQDASTMRRIQDLELALMYEGVELEREKLKLARQRAIEAAKAEGTSLDAAKKEFDLRSSLLELQEQRRQTPDVGAGMERAQAAVGTFSSAAIDRIVAGSSNVQERAAKAAEDTAKGVGRLVSMARGGLTFA